MADNQYKNFTDEAILELKRLEKEQKRIESDKQKYEKAGHDKRQRQYKDYQKRLEEIKELTSEIIEDEKIRLQISKEDDKSLRNQLKLTVQVRKELGISSNKANVYSSISEKISKEKAKALVLDGEQSSTAQKRADIMSSVLSDMESQAKQVERAIKGDDERAQFDQRRLDIQSMKGILTKEEIEELKDAVDRTEELYNREQRILGIKSQQQGLYNSMPESLKSAVSFGQELIGTLKKAGAATAGIAILGAILVSAVTSFIALDAAADEFNDTTKIAISQMGEMQAQANRIVGDFREIGLEAKDYYDIQAQIVGVLGDSARVSDSIAGAQAILTKNFGVTNEAAAKTLQIFQSLGGVSENTAASLQLQTMELARQSGVAPAKVLEDIADSSESIYGAFRGNSEELVKAAVQSRRLGTNLKDVLETTSKLLDFESSITQELEASAFVGGQFNLTQARALRASGKVAEAQEEILRQIQRSGDFRQQDVFTQQALAAAAGMTVDEIARQLTTQERLNSLSADQKALAEEAISQGLDITNINDKQLAQEVQKFALQKEQQGQVANLTNAFQGIVATLGASLVPLLESITPILQLALTPIQLMAEGLSSIVGFISEYKEIFGTLVGLAGGYWAIQKGIVLWQRKEAVLRLLSIKRASALAAITALSNPAKALAGIAAASIVTGLAIRYASKADDAIIPGSDSRYGKRALLEEGQVTLFNNRDTIVAGTNLDGGGTTSMNNGTDKLIRTIERLEKAYSKGAQVNLDGQRVMRGLGRVGNETTQNNFSLV